MTTTESAYAKINLSLDVTGRRADGYHEIDGVMQCISLCDELSVTVTDAPQTRVRLRAEGNDEMPTDEKNLAVRAALMYLKEIGREAEVLIELKKKIPMAGGLAGGSTDAAAALRALNRLYGYPLKDRELCLLGSRLGADVPFCIMGGCMRTEGIGDRLTVCTPMPECSLVIARRGEGVSTPWAYGRLDELYHGFARGHQRPDAHLPELLRALEAQKLRDVADNIFNLFEEPVSRERPDVKDLCRKMLQMGALASHMSGSGPTVFGIFLSEEEALRAAAELRKEAAAAYVCHPISKELLRR